MNIKEIKELVKMLDGTDISEFTMENEGNKISIKKGIYTSLATNQAPIMQYSPANLAMSSGVSPVQPIPTPAEEKNEGLGPNQVLVTAPMVGTFYRAPSPEAEPYVQLGQTVEAGQVVCIIEAMKLMNEIESEWHGKIFQILAENAQPVEYGQPLFILEKV